MRIAQAVAVMVLASACALLLLGARVGRAQVPSILDNGWFESGTTGWIALPGGTIASDSAAPIHQGTKSAKLTSTGAGTGGIRSQYWRSPVNTANATAPGYRYTLSLGIRYEAVSVTGVTARLDLVDVDGVATGFPTTVATLASPRRGTAS